MKPEKFKFSKWYQMLASSYQKNDISKNLLFLKAVGVMDAFITIKNCYLSNTLFFK
jgi:hypothetical protein